MALTDFNVVLAELSAVFDDLVVSGDLAENLAYPPLLEDLNGRSPVFSLHYDGSNVEFKAKYATQFDHGWRGTLYINRVAHGNASSEALMLSLVAKLLQRVRDNVTGTSFDELVVGEEVAPSFIVTDGGINYRIVEIRFATRSYDTN